MKTWQLLTLSALAGVASFCWWWMSPSSDVKDVSDSTKVLRSRKIREVASAKGGKVECRIKRASSVRKSIPSDLGKSSGAKDDANAKCDWDPFKDDKDGFDLDLDFDFAFDLEENGSKTKMPRAVRGILAEMGKAQARFDKKGVIASVRRLLAMGARGESVPPSAKYEAVQALSFAGGGIEETLPEIVQLAADENPEIAKVSLSALQEMLWDFDTTPRQVADAIAQLVTMTTDVNIINPFIFEMNDMPTSIKVETTLKIMDSGNETAISALGENMAFVYDDFTGAIQTREDVVKYGETHPDVIEE